MPTNVYGVLSLIVWSLIIIVSIKYIIFIMRADNNGEGGILALLALILSRRLSPLVALILVPTVASLGAGFGLQTSQFILSGIQQAASFAAMCFASVTSDR